MLTSPKKEGYRKNSYLKHYKPIVLPYFRDLAAIWASIAEKKILNYKKMYFPYVTHNGESL